jgi:hypothetical protein
VGSPRLEETPLNQPITTKLSARDYKALLDRARVTGINQTALVRLAIRQYLIATAIPASKFQEKTW